VGAEHDLTALAPWLTRPDQIHSVHAPALGNLQLGAELGWWHAYPRAGAVWLASPSLAPGALDVSVLRPHSSWVNGADSLTGPTADTDVLAVDLAYAAAAGHIEAWRLWADRLADAAAEGRRASQEMAAREFTRLAAKFVPAAPGRVQHGAPFHASGYGSLVL
jgi:hypothetical protein